MDRTPAFFGEDDEVSHDHTPLRCGERRSLNPGLWLTADVRAERFWSCCSARNDPKNGAFRRAGSTHLWALARLLLRKLSKRLVW